MTTPANSLLEKIYHAPTLDHWPLPLVPTDLEGWKKVFTAEEGFYEVWWLPRNHQWYGLVLRVQEWDEKGEITKYEAVGHMSAMFDGIRHLHLPYDYYPNTKGLSRCLGFLSMFEADQIKKDEERP